MRYLGQMKIYPSNELPADSSVSIGFECVDRDMIKPEKCYNPLAAAGIKYARCQTGWAKCEKEIGVYQFGWLDDMVDALIDRGVIPWFNVGYGNPAYMPNTPNPTGVGCMPLLYDEYVQAGWKNYVLALARHFKGRITHWEIWNEPDIIHFWYPGKPDAAALAELVKMTGRLIRSVIPDAKIGVCTAGSKPEYMSVLFENLTPADLDFYCYHTYNQYPEEIVENGFYTNVFELAQKNGLGHLEFWQGECGHASWHPVRHGCYQRDHFGEGSEHRQAVWQLRRFLLDYNIGLVRTSQFQIADMREKPYQMTTDYVQTDPACQGILHGLFYTPKKAHDTISRLSVILSGKRERMDAQFELNAPKSEHTPYTMSYLREGHELNLYWLAIPINQEAGLQKKAASVRLLSDRIERPMIIDMFTGLALEPEDCEWNAETRTITGLPIGEYPILICDRGALAVD